MKVNSLPGFDCKFLSIQSTPYTMADVASVAKWCRYEPEKRRWGGLQSTVSGFLLRIRHCFFGANHRKMVNCVSASAAAPYIEASIQRKQGLLSISIFGCGIEDSGKFGHSPPLCLQLDFLKAGFHQIISIDNVIIRTGR